MALTCEQIALGLAQLKERFQPCYRVTAEDLDFFIDLVEAIRQDACENTGLIGTTELLNFNSPNLEIGTTGSSSVDLRPLIDDKVKVINFGNVSSIGAGLDIAATINTLAEIPANPDYKTIVENEIVLLKGFVQPDRGMPSLNTYMVRGKGKGVYGSGGTITLLNSELELIERETFGGSFTPIITINNDPNAIVHDLGDITGSDHLTEINGLAAFTVEAGTNHFFQYVSDGLTYIYAFNGANGDYGTGNTAITDNDIFLIYDEANHVIGQTLWERGDGTGSVQTIGNLNDASGDFSTAMGQTTISSGQHSFSGGTNTVAAGADSVALGSQNIANGAHSLAMGAGNTSEGWVSNAFGLGNTAHSYAESTFGTYGTDYTAAQTIGWDNADRILNVGIGTALVSRADAFTILKSGLMTAPSMSIAMIDAGPDRTLVTKEWHVANAGGGVGTLDSVTTAGSITSNNIGIGDEMTFFDVPDGGRVWTLKSDDDFKLLSTNRTISNSASHTFAGNGIFSLINDNNFPGNIVPTALTANRNFNFPDKSGTFALLDDLTLEGYSETGTRATGLVSLIGDYDESNNGNHIEINDNLNVVNFNGDGIYSFNSPNAVIFENNIVIGASPTANTLVGGATAARSNTLPDGSGTLALSVNGVTADATGNITVPLAPYQVYTAMITHNGAADPTIKVLENTLGVTPTITRIGTGIYSFAAAVDGTTKTAVILSTGDSSNDGVVRYDSFSSTPTVIFNIKTWFSGAFNDVILNNTFLEVRIYN